MKRTQELVGQNDDNQVNIVSPPAPAPEPEPQATVAATVAQVPAEAQAPLPEARASVNVRLTIAGRECQLTLRDHDEVRLLARLEEVLQRFPLPQAQPPAQPLSPQQHNALAMHRPVTDVCKIHNVQMQRHENAKGVWYSHYIGDGQHCKGRARRPTASPRGFDGQLEPW
jgi:hypothetical protein